VWSHNKSELCPKGLSPLNSNKLYSFDPMCGGFLQCMFRQCLTATLATKRQTNCKIMEVETLGSIRRNDIGEHGVTKANGGGPHQRERN